MAMKIINERSLSDIKDEEISNQDKKQADIWEALLSLDSRIAAIEEGVANLATLNTTEK
ncbi:hypothetical protein EUAN_12250 [Andreesenia angusta]|uniref:Uncharacterized protein n=1 Tax=Andreesenia angusta TaxID=39480 RepID=A0A1S1V696_9FIRM|nr:hypothetical protein [Andreesenia angusta]OHW62156.1 hypothetical protein EUAN_12250 [Andreesenia angusta]